MRALTILAVAAAALAPSAHAKAPPVKEYAGKTYSGADIRTTNAPPLRLWVIGRAWAAVGRKTGGAGWSQENLIVPGDEEVYAAPGGVAHYVADHSYLPPPAFIAAVMACPDCGETGYFDALRRANRGRDIPLESNVRRPMP